MNRCPCHREHMRNTSLDALALVACALSGRIADGQAMLDSYSDPAEREELFGAVLAHAAEAIKALAIQAGITPDVALGGIFASIRAMP